MCRAPASSAFSTSSFTTEAGRSITSPAAILAARCGSRTRILALLIVRGSTSSPRTGRSRWWLSSHLVLAQQLLGTAGDALRHTRQAGHMHTIRSVRAAGHDAVQEHDVLTPFQHFHSE